MKIPRFKRENKKTASEQPLGEAQEGMDRVNTQILGDYHSENTTSVKSARKLLLDFRRREIFLACRGSTSVPILTHKLKRKPDSIRHHIKMLVNAGLLKNESFKDVKYNEITMTDFGFRILREIGE